MRKRIALRASSIALAAATAVVLTGTAAFAAGQIGPGSTGQPVKCVQEAMNYINADSLSVDGDYGPQTTAAVESYQSTHGLSADGLVGPATGGSIKTVVDNDISTHSGGPNQTLIAWQKTCDSLLEGSIS